MSEHERKMILINLIRRNVEIRERERERQADSGDINGKWRYVSG